MPSITKAYSEVLSKVLFKCTIHDVYEYFVLWNKQNYVYIDDHEIEVLPRSSKNGTIGQDTLYSVSSSALNFHGRN